MKYYNKVDIFITSRTSSTRLKKKYSSKIGKYDAISFQILRAKDLKRINSKIGKIIITTGNKKKNYALEKYSKKFNIEIFYGDENNLSKRYLDACNKYKTFNFLRCLADDIFFCVYKTNKLINLHLKSQSEYSLNKDICLGTSLEVINVNFVKYLYKNKYKNTEYMTFFALSLRHYNQNIKFYKIEIEYENKFSGLTLDTKKDLDLMNLIVSRTKSKASFFRLRSVLKKIKKINIPNKLMSNKTGANTKILRIIKKDVFNSVRKI